MRFTLALAVAAVFLTVGAMAAIPLDKVDHAMVHRAVEDAALRDRASAPLTADASLRIANSLFNKITSKVVPVLNEAVTKIPIKGEDEKHFSFSTFHLSSFHIDSLTVRFEAPNKVTLSLDGLSLGTPQIAFEVKDKILFVHIHCSGHLWASLAPSSLVVTLDMSSENGVLVTKYAGTDLHLGHLSVDYKMDHGICKVAGDIIHLFIKLIEKKVDDVIKQDIPSAVSKALPPLINKELAKIPFHMVSQPDITNTGITVNVDLIRSEKSYRDFVSGHPARDQGVVPVKSFGPRDLNLALDETCADHLLEHWQLEGKLNLNFTIDAKYNTSVFRNILPKAYEACPGCPMKADFRLPVSPLLNFGTGSAIAHIAEAGMHLTAVSSRGAVHPLFVVGLNVTAGLTNVSVPHGSSLRFDLAINTFTFGVEQSSVGPFSVSLISDIVSFLLKDVIVPDFNKKFNGIPIPSILTSAELELAPGKFSLGFNVNI